MQLRLPWSGSVKAQPAREARHVVIDGQDVPVLIARHRLARRYVVRVTPEGGLRLTVPRGASIAGGCAFAQRQSEWIAREMARQRARREPWVSGTPAWFRGAQVPITVDDQAALLATERVELRGSGDDVRRAIEGRLRQIAEGELPHRCFELADTAGLAVTRVSVRNQRSRWGACSPRAVITLNWRLVQMPESVRDYVIFHELMHIKQPNHSRRFWREVDGVCAWWRDAERWLRRHGRELLP